jgi:hypothetical protein
MPLTVEAAREADRAEAQLLLLRMDGFGGPAQPTPTIAQCLNGGYANGATWAWNDSRAGSLDSSALGGVERKGLPIGTYAPLRRGFC